MASTTEKLITAELARMRMWRRLGDEHEASLCSDRIDELLDRINAARVVDAASASVS